VHRIRADSRLSGDISRYRRVIGERVRGWWLGVGIVSVGLFREEDISRQGDDQGYFQHREHRSEVGSAIGGRVGEWECCLVWLQVLFGRDLDIQ
jgi:hypothetical protein